MQRALVLARHAETVGEVPVGAILVRDNNVIGEGFNQPISQQDPTAHAEINALRAACNHAQNYRLPDATLYVTLEPCAMCAGALIHARVKRVVIATAEPRAGAGGSVLNILQNEQLNHQCEVEFGVYQQDSADMLRAFFRSRR
ncbi:tRNA-adenosine deaminase [Arenicella xantha]|uniref:tRNA-specific adenosine deaminase n=2 Tax=Arenicella xantha TaxID=644221 RepID=A0A395JIM8_9GAMM|nr:tRNA-adenosine deaminase [Arenicella xantha]